MSSEHSTTDNTIQYHSHRRRRPIKSNRSILPDNPPEHCTFKVGLSEDQNSKWRRKNEDTCSFAYDFADEKDQGFFAVFDGHGGRGAADWAAEHVQQVLKDSLKKYHLRQDKSRDNNDNNINDNDSGNLNASLSTCNDSCDYWPIPSILDHVFQEIDSQLTSDNDIFAGCTAVVALIRNESAELSLPKSMERKESSLDRHSPLSNNTTTVKDDIEKNSKSLSLSSPKPPNRVLYVANVGDSRAVLCRDGKAIRLSYDHRASDPYEQQRIRDIGGFVVNDRVSGMLAVTRSLGDAEMKEYIVGRPYCSETIIDYETDKFLILACDGLWDVCTDQEACDLVKDIYKDPQLAARSLVKYALERESTDNITVMFITFLHK